MALCSAECHRSFSCLWSLFETVFGLAPCRTTTFLWIPGSGMYPRYGELQVITACGAAQQTTVPVEGIAGWLVCREPRGTPREYAWETWFAACWSPVHALVVLVGVKSQSRDNRQPNEDYQFRVPYRNIRTNTYLTCALVPVSYRPNKRADSNGNRKGRDLGN